MQVNERPPYSSGAPTSASPVPLVLGLSLSYGYGMVLSGRHGSPAWMRHCRSLAGRPAVAALWRWRCSAGCGSSAKAAGSSVVDPASPSVSPGSGVINAIGAENEYADVWARSAVSTCTCRRSRTTRTPTRTRLSPPRAWPGGREAKLIVRTGSAMTISWPRSSRRRRTRPAR